MLPHAPAEEFQCLLNEAVLLARRGGVHTGAALLDILEEDVERAPDLWGRALPAQVRSARDSFRRGFARQLADDGCES